MANANKKKKVIKTWIFGNIGFLFVIFIWLLFVLPYFVKQTVPYPSDYLVNNFAPWSAYEQFWGPVKNTAMPDIVVQIYPWKYFTIESLKQLQIPLWNPNSFSGSPHMGNYQTAVFSPFNIIFFILPFVDAWSLLIFSQPLLAGIFTYFLARQYKMSTLSSAIASVSFMFCGFGVVWMAYGTLFMAMCFLPLSLLAIQKCFQKLSALWLIVLTFSVLFSFFSGHFQMSLYFFAYVSLYWIYNAIKVRNIKTVIYVGIFLSFGVLLSLPQILPTVELYNLSVRSKAFIEGGGIPIERIVTIFSPDFFGNPITRNELTGTYAEWAMFLGIIPFILAIYTLTKIKNARILFFWH